MSLRLCHCSTCDRVLGGGEAEPRLWSALEHMPFKVSTARGVCKSFALPSLPGTAGPRPLYVPGVGEPTFAEKSRQLATRMRVLLTNALQPSSLASDIEIQIRLCQLLVDVSIYTYIYIYVYIYMYVYIYVYVRYIYIYMYDT